jgi:hypothetical protein
MHLSLPLAAVVVGAGPAVVLAASIDIPTTYNDGADAFVYSDTNTVGTNYGSDPLLRVRSDGRARKSYLRFDLDQIPSGDTVSSASLKLTVEELTSDPNKVIRIYGINDGAAGDLLSGWTEAGLTWNNAPSKGTAGTANGASNAADSSTTTLLGTLSTPSDETQYSFSNAALANFLNSDTNGIVTFILTFDPANVGSSMSYHSSDSPAAATKQPLLSLVTVPEPATLSLLGLGSLALLRRRR